MSGHEYFSHHPSLSPARLRSLAKRFGTPLWVYDAETIRDRVSSLRRFDTVRYAQKANSNIHILRRMRAQGVKVDSVSLGEIERALAAGYSSRGGADDIVFTADLIDHETLDKVVKEEIPVNAGSIDMLPQVGALNPGHRVWLRINPGFGHGHSNKTNTGGEHSKHGIWHERLPDAIAAVSQHRLQLCGLHMHIGSGVDYAHLASVCDAMVDLAHQVTVPFSAISAGGGLSIPYRREDVRPDIEHYYELWDAARNRLQAHVGRRLELELEPGRYLMAEAGLLLAEVRAVKSAGRNRFVLVDAGFSDLMRPAMYGSHHDITLLPCNAAGGATHDTVVAGPLCESGDVFTQSADGVVTTQALPSATVGDLVMFHDAGAYGASMSSNYNSRPLAAEVLVDGDQEALIRRRQQITELIGLELDCEEPAPT